MQIRNKLTFYFTVTSSLLMLLILAFIYLLFSESVKNDFYQTLRERTEVAAQVYLEADEISATALQKLKEKYLVSLPGEVIRLYDSTDREAFIAEKGYNWGNNIINITRRSKYIAYEQDNRQTVGIDYDDNQGNFVVLASATDFSGLQKKKNLLQIMAALFGIQLLIQLVAGRWFAGRMLAPIQQVNGQVRRISATDLHLRVKTENDKDEIGILAANFNSLLERLETSFDLQKMFVANASHELSTPVTNMIGEIEVILNKDRNAEDYRKALQSVLAETDRLNDIIKNFLLLANAENNIAELAGSVRLDDLLWEIKDIYTKQGSQVNIVLLDMPADEESLVIRGSKTLLLMAISNIVQNAIKFSHGAPVTCSLSYSGGKICIAITDEGIGMDEATIRNIFEPFFRFNPGNQYKGYGIGLYIAKKILSLLHADIQVISMPGKGSTFNIYFTLNS